MSWIRTVEDQGLRYAKTLKGFYDEPLKGEKAGRRSIRLSKQWRAEYSIDTNGEIQILTIEEVHPHDY